MTLRATLAAGVVSLFAVACQSDQTVSPYITSPTAARSANTAVNADAAPISFTIFPSQYVTGAPTPMPTGTIAVASAATFDRTIHLSSTNPSALSQLPATITLPAGSDRVSVGLTVPVASSPTTIAVTASGAGASVTANLTLLPPGSPTPPKMIDTIFATPLTVAAGSPSTATIRLTTAAPAGGLVVGLETNLPLSATMPAAVTFPAGATVETVPITTFTGFPNSTTTVEIRALAGATVAHNGINVVTGNVSQPLSLGPTTLDAPMVGGIATVTGGTSLTGTVSLNGPAPSGGALITLVSTDTTVATVAPSVVIPAGATSATFAITTKRVSTASTSNIGGGFAGGFNVASLAVNPPSTAPAPSPASIGTPSLSSPAADTRFASGSTITFDWSDVSGATSYRIQISDTDKFTTTLVNQTVAVSQFTIATLPTKTLWWRVSASSASASGTFTSPRRFELK